MLQRLIIVGLFLFSTAIFAKAQAPCDGKQIFTQKDCAGDTVSAEEKALFDLVTEYRKTKNLLPAKLSVSLSKLANRHMIDITVNLKAFTHSWSNCYYDIKDEKTWPCIVDSPTRMNSGYNGQGYETLYVTTEKVANISTALETWKKSNLHNSIITNQGTFKDLVWQEIGVSVKDNYACLWFGAVKTTKPFAADSPGLGISYDQVMAGLSDIVPVKPATSTVESTIWKGTSIDKTIALEISGTLKDVSEAKMSITAKLQADGSLSPQNFNVLSRLLTNVFPTWVDRETWLQSTLTAIRANSSVVKTKILGKNHVEMRSGAGGAIILQIIPKTAVRAIEID